MKISAILKSCFLFSEIDANELKELERISAAKSFAEGNILFSEGEPARALYILADGEIDLIKAAADGREQLIRKVLPGENFAEAAVFSGICYPATAIARCDSNVVIIEKSRLIAFIKRSPEVSLKMMGSMSTLLRHLNTTIERLSLRSVESRLAEFLIKKHMEVGKLKIDIGMKKCELAFQLGTISETLSRTFKKMSKKGIISVSGNTINIKHLSKLKELS